jgi:hypothetical protein
VGLGLPGRNSQHLWRFLRLPFSILCPLTQGRTMCYSLSVHIAMVIIPLGCYNSLILLSICVACASISFSTLQLERSFHNASWIKLYLCLKHFNAPLLKAMAKTVNVQNYYRSFTIWLLSTPSLIILHHHLSIQCTHKCAHTKINHHTSSICRFWLY